MQDKDLISKSIVGDRVAQKALFLQHSPTLFQVAIRYSRSKEDAEDALQESWVNIFHNLGQYKEEGKFFSWMKTIVINKALRKRNAGWFKTDLVDVIDLPLGNKEPEILQDMMASDINNMIDQLPQGYSEIFKLHVIDGYKHNEIGEMMGIEASTSRSKLTIARKKLQKLIIQKKKVIQ